MNPPNGGFFLFLHPERQVIDGEIAAEPPVRADGVVGHALEVGDLNAVALEPGSQFRRLRAPPNS